MKKYIQYAAIILVMLPGIILAQELGTRPPSVADPGKEAISSLIQTTHNGSAATSLEALIETSDVIVRARYGRLIKNELFYGFQETKEQVRKRLNITDEALFTKLGLPLSEYEIDIEEIIKDDEFNSGQTKLTLAVLENLSSPNFERITAYREGEHLLFLTRNPDTFTYGLRGSMFDMKREGSSFIFMIDQFPVSTFGSGTDDSFLNAIREIVEQQN